LSESEIAEAAIRIINNAGVSGALFSPSSAAPTPSKLGASVNHRGAYATVALTANRVGRKGVANLLLLLETSVADKVPALISTGSFPDAMAVSTAAR
jgi:hypothetical protein